MEDFFNLIKRLVDDSPTFIKMIIYGIIVLGIITVFSFIIAGSYKFMKSVDKESRALDLSRDNRDLSNKLLKIEKENEEIIEFLEMLHVYLSKVKSTISDMKRSDYNMEGYQADTGRLISDFINLLSNKICVGNHSRVSLWVVDHESTSETDEEELKVLYRSSNFPYNDSKSKCLSLNESIAGRAYRKKKPQFSCDLKNDPDWEKYSFKTYSEIFAFPINTDYILTIDFKKKTRFMDRVVAQTSADQLSYIYEMIEYLETVNIIDDTMDSKLKMLLDLLSDDKSDRNGDEFNE